MASLKSCLFRLTSVREVNIHVPFRGKSLSAGNSIKAAIFAHGPKRWTGGLAGFVKCLQHRSLGSGRAIVKGALSPTNHV